MLPLPTSITMSLDPLRLRISALMGFLAIFFGARGAHGGPDSLYQKLVDTNELAHWQTAVQYHMLHAVVLVALALCTSEKVNLKWAWRLVLAGILLFSGSLYAQAYFGIPWLSKMTPIGGLCLMAGWAAIAIAAKMKPAESKNS